MAASGAILAEFGELGPTSLELGAPLTLADIGKLWSESGPCLALVGPKLVDICQRWGRIRADVGVWPRQGPSGALLSSDVAAHFSRFSHPNLLDCQRWSKSGQVCRRIWPRGRSSLAWARPAAVAVARDRPKLARGFAELEHTGPRLTELGSNARPNPSSGKRFRGRFSGDPPS